MAARKDCFALIGKFEARAKVAGVPTKLNRYAEQWAADALLESYTMAEVTDAMEYYFEITPVANINWKLFARNVDGLMKSKMLREQDEQERAFRREQMRGILGE